MRKVITDILLLPLLWILLTTLSIVLYAFSFLPRILSGDYYHFLSRLWCKLFIRVLGIDLTLIFKNAQPIPQQYILIANHPSVLEDFAIPAMFDVYPLAKEGVRDWFLLGRISDYAGTIFFRREDARSRHMVLQDLADAVRAGKNLVIFPEGGCKGRRLYKKFKKGAFDVSLRTGIPILPVFLHYEDEDAFEWAGQPLIQKLWQIFKADNKAVNYYVHDAIYPDEFQDKDSYAEAAYSRYQQWQEDYLFRQSPGGGCAQHNR